ncbi:MAG: hypothetical protein ABJN39_09315 [Sulfitobacter sp.]|uniref:phage tail tube protein n=1 Tax=Alphaproteobacteria TaxID=28211 RepID=UPI0029436699|nr:hypothetical protein [Sulfitobacter sp. LC.270.F.C4]WOI13573.1 hypothetical protein R1T45_01715 [Sulfitobacter sp. LC.270.F.C4]
MTENHIGKTLWVAQAAPATNDAAGFEALTWVEAKGHITLPQLGVTHSMIDVPDLKSGFTSAVKGAAQGVDTTATFRDVDADPGQEDVRETADGQGGIMSIKVVKGSGVDNAPASGDPVQYAQGIVHSYQPNQGDNSNYEGFSVGFRQNAPTVTGTEPV